MIYESFLHEHRCNVLFVSCLTVVLCLWLFAEQRSSRLFMAPRQSHVMSLSRLPFPASSAGVMGHNDEIFFYPSSLHKQILDSRWESSDAGSLFFFFFLSQTSSCRVTQINLPILLSCWRNCERRSWKGSTNTEGGFCCFTGLSDWFSAETHISQTAPVGVSQSFLSVVF